MNQPQQQISMDEVFAAIGDLYLQLRLAQKQIAELTAQLREARKLKKEDV